METVEPAPLDQSSLQEIEVVTFYKRDGITTDLIFCEVRVGGRTLFFHENWNSWESLIRQLQQLPGFRSDWCARVSQPAFVGCETVAFRRQPQGPLPAVRARPRAAPDRRAETEDGSWLCHFHIVVSGGCLIHDGAVTPLAESGIGGLENEAIAGIHAQLIPYRFQS
jgi:hypothetical protein